jgi:hypothetical protein
MLGVGFQDRMDKIARIPEERYDAREPDKSSAVFFRDTDVTWDRHFPLATRRN